MPRKTKTTNNLTTSDASGKKLSDKYQKKTDIEHILDAPDTYIGQIDEDDVKSWVLHNTDNGKDRMSYKEFKWIPGLFKLFDEGIVNCRDHFVRLSQLLLNGDKKTLPVTNIEIEVSDEGVITMYNNGNGIDVEKHPDHDLWIPEMIFGHLRTSTNYDKSEKKITGGKNGFGFKLVLIYSLWGEIETIDHIRKKKYCQRFENNLNTICKPKITKNSQKPYTKITFMPDYERFGIEKLTPSMFELFKKRTWDIAAVTDKTVKVKFNKELLPVRTFEQYINLYIGNKQETTRAYENKKRWEICVCVSKLQEFTQISFVNGINTGKGGKHVDYIVNQIVKKISALIYKKKKINVKPSSIKEQLMVFVKCEIENPSFDSQTKDFMNTPISKFGSKCEVSDAFIKQLVKMGIMDSAMELSELKESKAAKKTDGKNFKTVRGVPKLMDAEFAGTKNAKDCTIIFCEGDSAKAGIISGLSKEDRKYFGVFPLKGKLMNVLDVPQSKINKNEEITQIKKVLGLGTGAVYSSIEDVNNKLRYGKILFMTDQDLDGSHIKGLGVNLFNSQWKEMLSIDNFLGFMNTPIIKATKGKKVKPFYNESDYEIWKESNNGGKGWKIKYYKGLGTSTSNEFKEYFKDKKMITFTHSGDKCSDALDMVFNKNRSDDRKDWLENYKKDARLDTDDSEITYNDFIDREFIHFSKYDCERSIANVIDGFKISTRKILYSTLKRNLVSEIKVAQLSGYVSEHSGYHHGEMSLNKAIVGMAQEYTGSNNIALLMPNGQFGTRLMGGKDSASERYIYTKLNDITKRIFPEADKPILNYLSDDGTPIEPDYYVPIIPMVLVNGGKGIGTGFSYDIMSYNVVEIIDHIYALLKKNVHGGSSKKYGEITPYYHGFKGDVIKINDQKYLFKGNYKVVSCNTIHVTELPVGTWSSQYREYLESLMETSKSKKKPLVKSVVDLSTESNVDFKITLPTGVLQSLLTHVKDKELSKHVLELEKKFKLYTTEKTTNMHLFNHEQQLKKYKDIYEIITDYIPIRYELYVKRKEYILNNWKKEIKIMSNKARFIKEQCDETLDLRKKKRQMVIDILKEKDYDTIDNDDTYSYLRSMPIDSVIEENIDKLNADIESRQLKINKLESKTPEQLWMTELKSLKTEYSNYVKKRDIRMGLNDKNTKTSKKSSKVKSKKTSKVKSKK